MRTTLFLLFFTAAFSISHADTVVATYGNHSITLSELNQKYEEVSKSLNPPSKEVFLEDYLRYKVGLEEARRRKLESDPVIAERINQELYKGLIEKDLGKEADKLNVTESDMVKYYRNNPEVRISHILIEQKPGANATERAATAKRSQQIYKDVKSSKRSFEELANLYSDDSASKKSGGDIGWHTKNSIVPALYNVAEKLRIGHISTLIETEFGYHIIKLTGKNPYSKANKQQIRFAVLEEKKLRLFNRYFDKLKSSYKVRVNKSALK